MRTGKWSELVLTKAPKVTQIAVGHDGLHAILVTEDGSAFFAGLFSGFASFVHYLAMIEILSQVLRDVERTAIRIKCGDSRNR